MNEHRPGPEISPEALEAVVAKLLPGLVETAVARLLPELVRRELSSAVAAQLPEILAQRLPDLAGQRLAVSTGTVDEPPTAAAAAPPLGTIVPVRTRVASDLITAYARDLAAVAFDPEASTATTEARDHHWKASRALDHARSALAEAEHDDGRAVAKEVADGREALGDLLALSASAADEPVPTAAVPTAAASTAAAPTDAAPTDAVIADPTRPYRWLGAGSLTFPLDRPDPRRTAFVTLEVFDTWTSYVDLVMMQSGGARRLKQVGKVSANRQSATLIPVPPAVTHLRVGDRWKTRWALRIVDPSDLPLLTETASGPRGSFIRHEIGARRAVLQCIGGLELHKVFPCDCSTPCEQSYHQRSFRIENFDEATRTQITLPEEPCVLWVDTFYGWSIDLLS